MVGALLGLPDPPAPDHAADAFAVAICHAGGAGMREAIEPRGRATVGTRAAAAQRLAG